MPFEIQLDSSEIRHLSQGLLTEREIEAETEDIVSEATILMQNLARQFAPRGNKRNQSYEYIPGSLKESIERTRVKKVAGNFSSEIFSDLDYAEWVERGTGIYIGKPRIKSKSGGPMKMPPSKRYNIVKGAESKAREQGKHTELVFSTTKDKSPFVMSQRGQKGKHFFSRAYDIASEYVEARLHTFRIGIEERLEAIARVRDDIGSGGGGIRAPRPPRGGSGPINLSPSGRSRILTPGNLPQGVFRTQSVKSGIINTRLTKGPGGGRFTFKAPTPKQVSSQRRKALRRNRKRR